MTSKPTPAAAPEPQAWNLTDPCGTSTWRQATAPGFCNKCGYVGSVDKDGSHAGCRYEAVKVAAPEQPHDPLGIANETHATVSKSIGDVAEGKARGLTPAVAQEDRPLVPGCAGSSPAVSAGHDPLGELAAKELPDAPGLWWFETMPGEQWTKFKIEFIDGEPWQVFDDPAKYNGPPWGRMKAPRGHWQHLTPATIAALREREGEIERLRERLASARVDDAMLHAEALREQQSAAQSDALSWRTKFDEKCEEAERQRKALIESHAALSRIDYLCGPPNEMETSAYDLHCDEELVVKAVERLRESEAEAVRLMAHSGLRMAAAERRAEAAQQEAATAKAERDWAKHLSRRIDNQREELSRLNAEYAKVLSALSGTESLRVKAEAERDALRLRVAELEAKDVDRKADSDKITGAGVEAPASLNTANL